MPEPIQESIEVPIGPNPAVPCFWCGATAKHGIVTQNGTLPGAKHPKLEHRTPACDPCVKRLLGGNPEAEIRWNDPADRGFKPHNQKEPQTFV